MVPPYSVKISRVPTYSISLWSVFVYGAITHYGLAFQLVPLTFTQLKGCSPFARHYLGNLGWFLFLWVLRCFSSPGSPPHTYVFSVGYPAYTGWVSPFGHRRIKACLSAPRRFSQITTSFIASDCQGIHRIRLVTWPYNPKGFLIGSFIAWTSLHSSLAWSFATANSRTYSDRASPIDKISTSVCAQKGYSKHTMIRTVR